GMLKPLSYAGKTVEIMVSPIKDVGYIFIVGGNALQPPERDDFLEEFQGPKKPELENLLPKHPVRIGEEWSAPLSPVGAVIGGEMRFNLDNDQSRISSKLLQVYGKRGHQWGVVEMKIHLVITPAGKGPDLSGTISAVVTLDAVIDGSSSARSMRMRMDGALSAADAKGVKTTLEIQGEQEQTRTPVKCRWQGCGGKMGVLPRRTPGQSPRCTIRVPLRHLRGRGGHLRRHRRVLPCSLLTLFLCRRARTPDESKPDVA